jgi:DNA-binding response OmpR family regulator
MTATKILIVDDESGLRESFSIFLDDLGFQVDTAFDVASALEKLKTQTFEIVITDKNMPVDVGTPAEAGLQVLRFVTEHMPDTQVVIMTGYASLESAVQFIKLGAFDYLVKPFSFKRLEETIDRILAYRSFINSPQVVNHYRSLHNDILGLLEQTHLDAKSRHELLRSIEDRIDNFFTSRKALENIIIDQRDSLAGIAMHAGMLNEALAKIQAEGDIAHHLQEIARLADRRV